MRSRPLSRLWITATILIGMAVSPPVVASAGEPAANAFDRNVAPILARRCLDCHAGSDPKGKLDLSRKATTLKGGKSGAAVAPGNPDGSLLWGHVADDEMPPKKPLPAAEKAVLKAWIASGADWGTDPIDAYAVTTDRRAGRDWWAFQPVVRPKVPTPKSGPVPHPIDAFILERLSASGLKSSPPVGRRTLIRRLSFDLLGLPPAPERVEAFVNDARADAYERLVDEFLASPDYGVRWARLWLDLARFAESNGFEFDEFRPAAWPYRDWVVNALNKNLPFDEFTRLQLAGDVLRPDDPEAVEATGFLVAGAFDSPGQSQQSLAMRKVVREDELEDVISTVGQTFLGLTVHCARCHDHKFDPIRQTEYYRLSSALAGVRHGERDLSDIDPATRASRRRIADLYAKVDAIEAPVRALLSSEPCRSPGPVPFARWDFDRDTDDRLGSFHAKTQGDARRVTEGLRFDGKTGFALTPLLSKDVGAKTLEAWVRLDNLNQRGGGVIGLINTDDSAFDSIVFGEREPGRWMAGSEGFARYKSFNTSEETDAAKRPVHVAIVYSADGTVTAYRQGLPFGTPYQTAPPPIFRAGQARVVFGMRHGMVPIGNRMLAGVVVRAGLYDRALSAKEVADSAASGGSISESALTAELSTDQRAARSRLLAEIAAEKRGQGARGRQCYAVSPRPPEPTHVLIRGNTANPGDVVAPGGVSALSGLPSDFGIPSDAPEGERRVRLSAWLTDPGNPLTARVLVNRLWQAHFGAGLVETPSDFGFNGGRPSHPELLDWLASEFVSGNWNLKALHRRIVTSTIYRQASHIDREAARADASDRLLWRKAPVRLEAEMVRDAMLAVSGALNPTRGGPGFREFNIERAPGTAANLYVFIEPKGTETDRRTLYRTWARGGRSGFLDAFDCPDPSTVAPKRTATTTPLQALAMLNNGLTLRLADRFAERLLREVGDDPALQADRAYRLAFGRSPDDAEREAASAVIKKHGAAALARAVFNSNEFLYVD